MLCSCCGFHSRIDICCSTCVSESKQALYTGSAACIQALQNTQGTARLHLLHSSACGIQVVLKVCTSVAGTYLTHSGWPHLINTCPAGERSGWGTSAVCPATKRLIRLAVDQARPFSTFQNRDMIIQHSAELNYTTLLPADMNGMEMSRSAVPWGCDTTAYSMCLIE